MVLGTGNLACSSKVQGKIRAFGSAIAAVDLVKGIGVAAGLKPVNVPGATGRVDTNFRGK